MQSLASNHVPLVEAFELKGPAEELAPAVSALVQKLEVEGVARTTAR